jgi:S1-C subfamily serine protease
VVPVKRGNSIAGYKVYPTDESSAFADLGLRSGDLIVAINGTRLDDPKVATGLVATLSWASGVAVTVKRGGHERDLVVSTERATANAAEQRQIQESATSAKDPVFHSRRPRGAPTETASADP